LIESPGFFLFIALVKPTKPYHFLFPTFFYLPSYLADAIDCARMSRNIPPSYSPLRFVVIGCWAVMILLAVWLGNNIEQLYFLNPESTAFSRVQGQDWVRWLDGDQHPKVEAVHPLLSYKPFLLESFQEGDQLLKINYHEVYQAEVADQISKSAQAGKTFIYQLTRSSATGPSNRINIQWTNGYFLSYSFNDVNVWWRLSFWLSALGAFAAFMVFLILRPFFQQNPKAYFGLGLIVALGFLIPASRLGHVLYLVVESDLIRTGFEKWFFCLFSLLLIGYSILIVGFRWSGSAWWLLPSRLFGVLAMLAISYLTIQDQAWGAMQPLLERAVLLFFILHLLTALGLWLWGEGKPSLRRILVSLGVLLCSVGAVWGYLSEDTLLQETALFTSELMLLFPVFNAASSRLPFGQVSVVMTRSLQSVVFIVL